MTATVELRPAEPGDEALLLAWANDPATRAASRVHEPIAAADHHRWLERRLATPDDARIWIGVTDGVPIGVVRFERRAPDAVEVSITIAPDARGRGLAGPLLQAGIDAAHHAFGPVAILAEILSGNDTSIRLFTTAGFTPKMSEAAHEPGTVSLELR
jgi:RimJ/RimL family protein N-acetyltransferase